MADGPTYKLTIEKLDENYNAVFSSDGNISAEKINNNNSTPGTDNKNTTPGTDNKNTTPGTDSNNSTPGTDNKKDDNKNEDNVPTLCKSGSLVSLEITKKIYTPCKIVAVLQYTATNNPLSLDVLSAFLNKKVNLSDGTSDIAIGYKIYDFIPEYKSSSTNKTLYVKLFIYSPEHELTLRKFNKCYVAKKLGEDVFKGIAEKNYPELLALRLGVTLVSGKTTFETNEVDETTFKTDNKLPIQINLQKLKQPELEEKKADNDSVILVPKNTFIEFIQPYMVQYDETPIDFLSRMANRCGEFMYFENGKWQLGLSVGGTVKNISSYDSLTYHCFTKPADYTHKVDCYIEKIKLKIDPPNIKQKEDESDKKYHERVVEKYEENDEKLAITRRKMPIMYDGPADENLCYYNHDLTYEQYTSKNVFSFDKVKYWVSHIPSWLKQDNVGVMLAKISYDAAKNSIISSGLYDDETTRYNKFFLNPFTDDDNKKDGNKKDNNKDELETDLKNRIEKCKKALTDNKGDTQKDADGNAKYKKLESKNAYLLTNKESYNYFAHKFYLDNQKYEEEAERQKIHVKLSSTQYMTLLLGDIIYLGEDKSKEYIITDIRNKIQSNDGNNVQSNDGNKVIFEFELDAVPVLSGNKYYPYPLPGGTIRKADPQLAVVTFVNDPEFKNRIQIAYHWQEYTYSPTEGIYSSPWLRIATPLASEKAAINFRPQKGDEVFVGYENGNIERPYVIGSVPKATQPLVYKEPYIIKSPNGHYIKFNNPKSGIDALMGFSPFAKTVMQFLPNIKWDLEDNDVYNSKACAGGIDMGDLNGFYQISMSSDKRSVTISSALGNVNISAFTGITIDAPNGNVKIKGKNVAIEAGNELKLVSGTNYKKREESKALSELKILGKSFVKTFLTSLNREFQLIDLTLLRTGLEAIFKPVGGTMLIKSHRFLRLEAGSGSTQIPPEGLGTTISSARWYNNKFFNLRMNDVFVKDVISTTLDLFETLEKNAEDCGNSYSKAEESYNAIVTNLQNIKNEDSTNVKFDNKDFQETIKTKLGTFADVKTSILNQGTITGCSIYDNLNKLSCTNSKATEFNTYKKNIIKVLDKLCTDYIDFNDLVNDHIDKIIAASIKRHDSTTIIECDKKDIVKMIKDAISANDYTRLKDLYINLVKIKWRETIHNLNENQIKDDLKKNRKITLTRILKNLIEEEKIIIKNKGGSADITNDDLTEFSSTDSYDVESYATTTIAQNQHRTKWEKFIDCIVGSDEDRITNAKYKTEFTKFRNEILRAIPNDIELDDWLNTIDNVVERMIYNPKIQGQILFSDTSGNTCVINGNSIKSETNDMFKSLKNKLRNI